MEIVHRCMMLAVQKRTSKHIQTRQCSDCNGKYPAMKTFSRFIVVCSELSSGLLAVHVLKQALNNVSTVHVNKTAESPAESSFKLFRSNMYANANEAKNFSNFLDGREISFTWWKSKFKGLEILKTWAIEIKWKMLLKLWEFLSSRKCLKNTWEMDGKVQSRSKIYLKKRNKQSF